MWGRVQLLCACAIKRGLIRGVAQAGGGLRRIRSLRVSGTKACVLRSVVDEEGLSRVT